MRGARDILFAKALIPLRACGSEPFRASLGWRREWILPAFSLERGSMSTLVSRRELLAGALASGVIRLIPSEGLAMQRTSGSLVANARGGYLFLPGQPFFSFGAIAASGFEINRAIFRRPPLFPEGLAAVERHLRAAGRPLQALCGLELRNGRQANMQEFMAFNTRYIESLRKAGMLVTDQMPLTRSNLVVTGAEAEHRIHAFTYTVPASSAARQTPTFVIAGIPEVRFLGPKSEIIAKDDVSLDGLRQKTAFVLETIAGLLTTMRVGWGDVTGIQLYTMRDLHPLVESVVLPRIGDAAQRGIQWHYVLLPLEGGDVEIDVRSVRAELTIDG